MIEELLKTEYGLEATEICRAAGGAGSDTFFARCGSERLVVKFPAADGMNNPRAEPALCAVLRERGIPACEFLKNRRGEYLSRDVNGRVFHVRRFVEGLVYEPHTAPTWLPGAAAALLGRIHTALRGYDGLPVGIGAEYFRRMTPQAAERSLRRSLAAARSLKDDEAERDIIYRLGLAKRLAPPDFDLSRLTCQASHGDYMPGQLVCAGGQIQAVIDWTAACVHPVVWEIVRFYVYACPQCAEGAVDMDDFEAYLERYLAEAPLNGYDRRELWRLFLYQSAVADYYGQYFASDAANRQIFRQQAAFTTELLRRQENRMFVIDKKVTD